MHELYCNSRSEVLHHVVASAAAVNIRHLVPLQLSLVVSIRFQSIFSKYPAKMGKVNDPGSLNDSSAMKSN